jgi:hypothetical protein
MGDFRLISGMLIGNTGRAGAAQWMCARRHARVLSGGNHDGDSTGLKVPHRAPMEEIRVDRGRYAMSTFVGPYDGLGAAWGAFTKQVTAAGHALDASRPLLEIYRDDGSKAPNKTPRTELYNPV